MSKGSITIGAVAAGVTIIAGALAFGGWIVSYVNSEIQPVQAQTIQNETDIASINANLSWIKSALQARGFSPIGQ